MQTLPPPKTPSLVVLPAFNLPNPRVWEVNRTLFDHFLLSQKVLKSVCQGPHVDALISGISIGQKKDPTEIAYELAKKLEKLQKWSQCLDVVCAHSPRH